VKNVLLLTDFSENSWNAIVYALHFFEKTSCNFYLFHVTKLNYLLDSDSPYIRTQDFIEDTYNKPSKQQLRKVLKRILKQFPANKKHKFYTLTDYNFFIEAIKKQIEAKKMDLIVMGTKGATGLQKLIIGSNTADVLRKIHCLTLVIPENAKFTNLREIAFPTDFTLYYNLKTLDPISEILEAYNATLRILHIHAIGVKLNTDQQENLELLKDYFSENQYTFHFLTAKKVEGAVQCFVESRNINMIAMVAKNLNYFQKILFHSKVEEISYHTDIPFLVLHE
jgi:nucleotide-binding universal stress UspA family protein